MNIKVKLEETGITGNILHDRQAVSIDQMFQRQLLNVLKGNING